MTTRVEGVTDRAARGAATATLCMVDLWIGAGVLDGGLTLLAGLSVHYAAVAILGAALLALGTGRRDDGLAWIAMAVLFGPVSGIVLGVLALAPRLLPRGSGARPGVTAPSETRAELLARRIREGRRRALSDTLPPSYAEIFDRGDLSLQERAMSAMSRGYRPQMRPALDAALASDIPAIRVQAAAIHAKLRNHYEGVIRTLSADGAVHDAARARAAVDAARSGFVKDKLATELLREADAGELPVSLDSPMAAPQAPLVLHAPVVAPPRLKRYACGGVG